MVLKESRDTGWELLRTKKVEDSDGFETDYTLYYNSFDSMYSCIFGDNDLYNPDNSEPDWEGESREEADEWFDTYTGFGEFEDEDFIDDFDDDFDEFDTDLDDVELDEFDDDFEESVTRTARKSTTLEDIGYEQCYIDTDGIMGEPNKIWSTSELYNAWCEDSEYDPSMLEFDTYEDWLAYTLADMSPVEDDIKHIFRADPNEERYVDVNGVMGDVGQTWSVSELRNYWEEEKDYDPTLADYTSFDYWLEDTLGLMEPVM